MREQYSVAGWWREDFDEEALGQWAASLRQQLTAGSVTLGLIFISPRFFDKAAEILETVRLNGRIPMLLGCSSNGLIQGSEELEDDPGISLGLYHLPEAKLTPYRFTQEEVEKGWEAADWHTSTGVRPDETNGWLVFADPFHMDCDGWLRQWDKAYRGKPIVGGLASSDTNASHVYFNGDVLTEGGIALSISGGVALATMISQGCTPIGETWTITKADRNIIYQIGNRPAYEVLAETFEGLSAADQEKARGNLFVGLAMNEYQEEFYRGDFLVRNLLGADPKSGALAVGALPRAGQTIQFQRRDAGAASEDLNMLLARAKERLGDREILGGCLCSCNGRGERLFGRPHHDAETIQRLLGPMALTGFFCNGEIGPVGEHNFLHGYTASLATFIRSK